MACDTRARFKNQAEIPELRLLPIRRKDQEQVDKHVYLYSCVHPDIMHNRRNTYVHISRLVPLAQKINRIKLQSQDRIKIKEKNRTVQRFTFRQEGRNGNIYLYM